MGDYYSTEKNDKRSITTFRMYADYETLVTQAYSDTQDYYNAYANAAQIYSVDAEICGEFTESNKGDTYSQAERIQIAKDWDAEKASLLNAFASNGQRVHDKQFYIDYKKYEAELDA